MTGQCQQHGPESAEGNAGEYDPARVGAVNGPGGDLEGEAGGHGLGDGEEAGGQDGVAADALDDDGQDRHPAK